MEDRNKKRRQHYVPQFYLRAFASDSRAKRIHLYNISRECTIRDVKITNQCYKNWFYGTDGKIEDKLSTLEGNFASALRELQDRRELPPVNSSDYHLILQFVAIQQTRTLQVITEAKELDRKFTEIIFDGSQEERNKFFGEENPMLSVERHLQNADIFARGYLDLKACLLINNQPIKYIMSDHPIFLYNTYLEETVGSGTTGAVQAGLQVFLPVSPGLCLLLYDLDVYRHVFHRGVRHRDTSQVEVNATDVQQINAMQFIGAKDNIFFTEDLSENFFTEMHQKYRRPRSEYGPRVAEGRAVSEANRSLVQTYRFIPNIRLKLSFLSLRKSARRVNLDDRIQLYRPSASQEVEKVLNRMHTNHQGYSPDDIPSDTTSRTRTYKMVREI